jgi:DNA-binding beta-propeller fold protein YncE
MKHSYLSGLRVVLALLILCTCIVAGVQAAESYTYVTKWGSYGTGDGQFYGPAYVAVDSAGNVYVADAYNNRIQKFSNTGTFLTKWGTLGSGDGQFNSPYGVAVDTAGNVYVSDKGNNRIQKFSGTGTFLTKWGTSGTGDGQFDNPSGMALDSSGNVYVADWINQRIQKFSNTGTFLAKWGSKGIFEGEFNDPVDVAVDSNDNVYVSDKKNNRIQKFSNTGTFLATWGNLGYGEWMFNWPTGIAVDSDDNIYVADTYNDRIQKFTSTGTFLTKWGTSGTGNGELTYPAGVAVDSDDNVFVADSGNNRIQKFSSTGTPVTTGTTRPATTVTTSPTTTVPTATATTAASYTPEPVATVTSEVTTQAYVSEEEPDLVVVSVESPVSARPGEGITVTDTIRNQGDAEIKSVYTNYYLSTNNVETRTGIMLQGHQHTISLLKDGEEDTDWVRLTIPSDIKPGIYYLRVNVFAKPQDNIKEDSNPWNNYLYAHSSITISDSAPGKQPDGLQEPVTGGFQQTTLPGSQLTTRKYTSLDALIALQMSVGKRASDFSYDLTNDGTVNSQDAIEILRRAAMQ